MRKLAHVLALTGALAFAAPGSSAQETALAETEPRVIEVTILGMACPFCSYGVQQKMKRIDGVTKVDVDLDEGLATVTLAEDADVSNEILIKAVKDAGFEVARIGRSFDSEYPDFKAGTGESPDGGDTL